MKRQPALNLYYKYLFFIGSLLLMLLLGFYRYIQPLLSEFYRLKDQAKIVAFQLHKRQVALQQTEPLSNRLEIVGSVKKKQSFLDQLIQMAEWNHCKILDLQTEVKGDDNSPSQSSQTGINKRLWIKMHIQSDFVSFYRFIDRLIQKGLPLQLKQFSLREQGDSLQIALQFSAVPGVLGVVEKRSEVRGITCCVRDPFQESPLSVREIMKMQQETFQNVDFKQLRYVGYFTEAGRTRALISLPDGHIADLYPGSRLGKTPWRVLNIQWRYLALLDREHNKVLQIQRMEG